MKYEVASELHKKEIFEAMAVTFKNRRKFIIETAPSITSIIDIYPKFVEFDGDLVSN